MGIGYINGGGGGGGVTSADVTARKENVLANKTTITADSDDAVVNGTMVDRGAVNITLAANGSYTIPNGYHNGQGKVTQNLVTKAGGTFYFGTADQKIYDAGVYLTSNATLKAVTASNTLTPANIAKGTTVNISNENGNLYSVAGTMTKYAHKHGSATSGTTLVGGCYQLKFTLTFIPVTGFAITYQSQNRDICICDPNTGGVKNQVMFVFGQQNRGTSFSFSEGQSGYTCLGKSLVIPVQYPGVTYHYFFTGYNA